METAEQKEFLTGTIEPGETAVICGFEGCQESENALRRIGLREGVEIEWVSGRNPVLLRCDRAHVAICPKLLQGVKVLRLPCESQSKPQPKREARGLLSIARRFLGVRRQRVSA